ncbi:MAG: hypothetical protein ACREBD_32635, partial [Blastocatellia bacterium]
FLIFLSYIFLLAKPKQENVGQENKDRLFLKLFTMAGTTIKAGLGHNASPTSAALSSIWRPLV